MTSDESEPRDEAGGEPRGHDESERPPAEGLIGGEHGDARPEDEGGSAGIGTA